MLVLMRRAAILSACVLVVALAPIVHRGGDSSRTAVGETACLSAATAEAARVGTPTPDPSKWRSVIGIRDDEAHCRLRRALLTKADVSGAGRADGSRADRVSWSSVVDCQTPIPAPLAGFTESVKNVTGQAFDGFNQWVYAFGTGGGSDLMRALKRNCSMLVASGSDDQRRRELVDVLQLGDESVAVRNSFGLTGIGAVYVRRGDLVAIVSVLTNENQATVLSQVGELAAAKLELVGPMPEPTYATGEGCVPSPIPQAAVAEKLPGGMLTLDDMPVGWVHDPPGPCGRINEEAECKNSDDRPPEPLAETTTGFRGSREEYVANKVEVYEGRDASTLIEGVRRALPAECLASLDGRSFGRHWDPIDVPALGDDAVGWRFTTRGLPTDANYYVILIRRGRTIATVAFQPERDPFDRAETIPVDFTRLAKRADSRLESIQQRLSGD